MSLDFLKNSNRENRLVCLFWETLDLLNGNPDANSKRPRPHCEYKAYNFTVLVERQLEWDVPLGNECG